MPSALPRWRAGLRDHTPLLIAVALLNGVAVLGHTRFAEPLGIGGWFSNPVLWFGANLGLVLAWGFLRVARAEIPPDLTPKQQRRASLRRRLRLASLVLIGGFGFSACEVYLRTTQHYATWLERTGKGYVSPYQDSSAQEFLLLPVNTVSAFQEPEFQYELRTNSEGLRDAPLSTDKPADEYRVLALGDSFTMGQGATFEQAWPHVLERSLARARRSAQVRVINAGIGGSDPVYCVRLLEKRLLKYKPDLVIQVVNRSDIGDVMARGGFERFLPEGGVAFRSPPRLEWLFARSHLARAVLMEQLGYDFYVLSPADQELLRRESAEALVEATQRLADLGAKHGFELLVVAHPMRNEVHPDPTTSMPLWELDVPGQIEANGLRVYDLRPFLQERIPQDQLGDYFWPIDRHCNARGYALFAHGIEQQLTAVPGFPRVLEKDAR